MSYDSARRARVADILERQNRAWDASPKTLENIARLRGGASALVTGQQVGLFGGPLFSMFKALSTVRLAREATDAGSDCVPVFWLATTDHDLDEISHVSILGPDGSLQKLSATTRGLPDAPVGTVTFGPEIEPVVEAAAGFLGDSEVTNIPAGVLPPGRELRQRLRPPVLPAVCRVGRNPARCFGPGSSPDCRAHLQRRHRAGGGTG